MRNILRDYSIDVCVHHDVVINVNNCNYANHVYLEQCSDINSSDSEHSRSKTSAIIAMYDITTTRVFVRYKTGGRNVVHCNYCTCLAT